MQAAVPGALLRSTAHAATITAAGGAGAFPASVAALASGTVHAMILSKLKLAATVAALGLGVAGTGDFAFQYPELPGSTPTPPLPYNAAPRTGDESAAAAQPRLDPGGLPVNATAPPLAPKTAAPERTWEEIQALAAAVRDHLAQGRKVEAHDTARRLSQLAQAWEASLAEPAADTPDRSWSRALATTPGHETNLQPPPIVSGNSAILPSKHGAPRVEPVTVSDAVSDPTRVPYKPNDGRSFPNTMSRPLSPAETPQPGTVVPFFPMTDQEQRIRRLENQVEQLLRKRRGPDAVEGAPSTISPVPNRRQTQSP
jgi:hypothetical protein